MWADRSPTPGGLAAMGEGKAAPSTLQAARYSSVRIWTASTIWLPEAMAPITTTVLPRRSTPCAFKLASASPRVASGWVSSKGMVEGFTPQHLSLIHI